MSYLGHPCHDFSDSPVPGESDDVDLHAIAGAEDSGLLDVVEVAELAVGAGPEGFGNGQLFPHFHRRRVNTKAYHCNATPFPRVS